MHRIARLTSVFLMAALVAGCTAGVCLFAPKAPGQAVASENNFENGVKQYEKGHYKQAVHEFEKAIEKDPTNYKAYYYLGISYGAEGSYDTGLGFLYKALGLVPKGNTWMNRIQHDIQAMTQKQEKHQGKGKGKDKDK